jgi:hypothetical protein
VFKRVISSSDVKPFLEIILPEDNVISESIITLNGTNYSNSKDFTNLDNRWFEMDALAEDKVLLKITLL